MIYNLSPTKQKYYRQNNNKLDPGVTCKPTATVECLDLAGWNLPPGEFEQPEDILTELCRSYQGVKRMIELDRTLNGTMPETVWGVISWAVNDVWFPKDRPIIGPRWDWTMRDVLFGIVKGRPFAASTWLTKGGHVVSVVGFETAQEGPINSFDELDLSDVRSVIIDDPYGDRTSGTYDTARSGWNNRYPIAEWTKGIWRGIGVQIRKPV
jgi:hypothetical protein